MSVAKKMQVCVASTRPFAAAILFVGIVGMTEGIVCGQDDLPHVVAAPGRPTSTVKWMDDLDGYVSPPIPSDAESEDEAGPQEGNEGPRPQDSGSTMKRYPKSRWIVDRPDKRQDVKEESAEESEAKRSVDGSYVRLAKGKVTNLRAMVTPHKDPVAVHKEPVVCSDDGCLWLTNEHWRPEGIEGPWPPDEYLCDGGDADTRVVISRQAKVSGLDPEDTIIHYHAEDGRRFVKPTNSVCIYAPRFAAVRKVRGMRADERLLLTQVVDQPLPPLTEELSRPPNILNQPEQPLRLLDIDRAVALRDRVRGLEFENGKRVAELTGDLNPAEDFQIMRIGINKNSEKARLAESILAAIVWSEAEAPEVLIDLVEANVDTTYEKAGVVYQLDQGPPCLRVIKLASSKSARPGETVEFAIRFDNVGDQTVDNVTVIDNLTTRLEYVPNSSRSDRDVEFFSDENEGESLTLRWRINEPLKPGDGGIITFKCKVR